MASVALQLYMMTVMIMMVLAPVIVVMSMVLVLMTTTVTVLNQEQVWCSQLSVAMTIHGDENLGRRTCRSSHPIC